MKFSSGSKDLPKGSILIINGAPIQLLLRSILTGELGLHGSEVSPGMGGGRPRQARGKDRR